MAILSYFVEDGGNFSCFISDKLLFFRPFNTIFHGFQGIIYFRHILALFVQVLGHFSMFNQGHILLQGRAKSLSSGDFVFFFFCNIALYPKAMTNTHCITLWLIQSIPNGSTGGLNDRIINLVLFTFIYWIVNHPSNYFLNSLGLDSW